MKVVWGWVEAQNTTSSESGLMEKRNLIGHILVDLGHIKVEQMEEALKKQEAYPGLKLGAILITMKALSLEQLEQGLTLQEKMRKLEREGNWKLGIEDITTPYSSDHEKEGTPAATPEDLGKMAWKLIGQILIEKGYATFEQVNEARRIQMYTTALPRPPIGMILREMGYASGEQIEEALKLQE
jgi:hypothetical protein